MAPICALFVLLLVGTAQASFLQSKDNIQSIQSSPVQSHYRNTEVVVTDGSESRPPSTVIDYIMNNETQAHDFSQTGDSQSVQLFEIRVQRPFPNIPPPQYIRVTVNFERKAKNKDPVYDPPLLYLHSDDGTNYTVSGQSVFVQDADWNSYYQDKDYHELVLHEQSHNNDSSSNSFVVGIVANTSFSAFTYTLAISHSQTYPCRGNCVPPPYSQGRSANSCTPQTFVCKCLNDRVDDDCSQQARRLQLFKQTTVDFVKGHQLLFYFELNKKRDHLVTVTISKPPKGALNMYTVYVDERVHSLTPRSFVPSDRFNDQNSTFHQTGQIHFRINYESLDSESQDDDLETESDAQQSRILQQIGQQKNKTYSPYKLVFAFVSPDTDQRVSLRISTQSEDEDSFLELLGTIVLYLPFMLVGAFCCIHCLRCLYARHLIRRRRQQAIAAALAGNAPPPSISNKEYLKLLDKVCPVKKIKPSQTPPAECCAICLEDWREDCKARCTLCQHYYHKKCLDEWLLKHWNCPLDRKDMSYTALLIFQKEEKENKKKKKKNNNKKQPKNDVEPASPQPKSAQSESNTTDNALDSSRRIERPLNASFETERSQYADVELSDAAAQNEARVAELRLREHAAE